VIAVLRDRLTAAGLSDERIQQHITAGRVRVDGELVTDLDTPAPGRAARGDLAGVTRRGTTPACAARYEDK
jgi:hypothetical protein